MSDGGGKQSGAENDRGSIKKRRPKGVDEFGRAVSRIAAAQICETTGFQSCQRSALDALADVAIRCISSLGKAAHCYANMSGRTKCNVFDLIQGLEDIFGSAQEFTGASDANRCLVSSVLIQGISKFSNSSDEVPFARAIPKFPVVRSLKSSPSFAQLGVAPNGKHIPDWLPAFPDPHTYIHTPVWNERTTDRRADKLEQTKQRRRAENSLLSLQQRITCTGAAGSVPLDNNNDSKGKQVVQNNPFLLPPLPHDSKLVFGKKIVQNNPFIVPPLPHDSKLVSCVAIAKNDASKKRFSVLETFAPAIEAAKTGALECRVSERRQLPSKRPPLHFRIGVDKKSVSLPLSSGVLGNRSDLWFLSDDQKDDKKRRAEMILKEAMENPQELIQL